MKNKYFQMSIAAAVFVFASSIASAITPTKGWTDSYSVNGKCYCATTFDHGIGDFKVSTPAGQKTVREVCNKLGKGPGKGNNPVYNTVQCGHEPGHSDGIWINGQYVKDEKVCPGRVDQGSGGCNKKGPKWDLSVYGSGGNGGNGSNGGNSGGGNDQCQNNNQCKQATGKNSAWCNIWQKGQPNACFCGKVPCDGNSGGGNNDGGNNDGGNNGGNNNLQCSNHNQCKTKTGKNDAWCNVWKNQFPINTCRCGGKACN